ncbi:hypothetical protein AO073_01380 [Pseudomonas syringae ICMP 11293]|uniref:hypothetical protein n=1 Tax=Pseudomonas syringae TaxID=317 RepID=UPI000730F0FC|nr:hypothetical protein [Pseudomonas syringae]KTB91552.1 hypothetical protein AO073_01380 [Pseudomonas syringae ICMP 11293]
MTNTNKISAAEFFLNDIGNFADDINFNGETIFAMNDKAVILKNVNTGKKINYNRSDLINDLNFQIGLGIFDDSEVTAENAQRKFVQIRSLLPA